MKLDIRDRVKPIVQQKNIVLETVLSFEDGDEIDTEIEYTSLDKASEDAIIQAAIAILEARPNGLKFIPASPQGLASLMRNF